MGFWGTLMGRDLPLPPADVAPVAVSDTRPRHRFAVGSDYETWNALVHGHAVAGRVSRPQAMTVPAVVRARNLIAGVIGTLPFYAFREPGGDRVDHALLAQPERLSGYVRSVTITRTVEDLIFDGASLWLVVTRTSAGFPEAVQRIEFGQWSQDTDTGVIRVKGREIPDSSDVVLFTSPCDPLLVSGAAAIRALITLERTASLYLDSPEPTSYFTPADGLDDPADDEDIERLLSDWQAARKARAVAYVPAAVRLNAVDRMTAEEMQLIDARQFAVAEIARLTGIDPTWLGLNTTTRTYSNITDERRSFVDFTLAPYLRAVEERLSLGDCTPRGQRVKANLDAFLRASTSDRYNAHAVALSNGFMTLNEVRELEDRPPLNNDTGDTDDE